MRWYYEIVEHRNEITVEIWSIGCGCLDNEAWERFNLTEFLYEFTYPIKYIDNYSNCLKIARDELLERGLIDE